jgi:ABC-type transport system substrate-binding protein
LFGNILGHELDLFAFWHSSQRNDPGLNIAQYADIDSDALLETSRKEHDPDLRTQIFSEFTDRVNEKHVAIFLYSPDFLYLVRDRVHNVRLHAIAEPSDRFNGIHEWYVETDRVWPFVKDILD